MQYECAVELERLTKRYRSTAVINNLTLSIKRGEVVGILGPNGAGKSTLMRLLIGAIEPTSGHIKILEKPIADAEIRHRIGYLPEECPIQDYLTPAELLFLHGSLARVPRREIFELIASTLDRVGVSEVCRIRELSRGTRQKLCIAAAILHNPDLVILDEPTAALDQKGRTMVRDLVVELAGAGSTILISSHLLTEIELACSRIIILNRGEVVADGSVAELTAFTFRIDVEVSSMNDTAMQALKQINSRIEYDSNFPERMTVHVRDKADSSAIAAALVRNGVELITLEPRMETLEELFVRLTEQP